MDCYVRWTFQSFCHWRCPCCPSPCRATSRTGPWLVGVGLSLVHIGLFFTIQPTAMEFYPAKKWHLAKTISNPTFTVHKLVSPKIWWLYAKHQTFVSPGASTNCRPNVRSPKNSKIWFPKWIYQWKNLKSTSANSKTCCKLMVKQLNHSLSMFFCCRNTCFLLRLNSSDFCAISAGNLAQVRYYHDSWGPRPRWRSWPLNQEKWEIW